MKKSIKLLISFILCLFCFLSANRNYAQNAYVLLELESWEYSKIKLHVYRQDSVLIDSFFVVRDSTFILKLPINYAYYLKIVSLNNLVDYKEMDKIIPFDFRQAKPYSVSKCTIDLQRYESSGHYIGDCINFPTDKANVLSIPRHKEILEMLAEYLKNYPWNSIKLIGHTDHLEKNKEYLSLKRAEAVKNYLLTHKISKSRIAIEGKADTEPTVPNITDGKKDKNNMALNRRVEFRVSQQFSSKQKAVVLVFADSITAQETQITGDLHYPSGDSTAILEKFIYSYENIKILYLFDTFNYTLQVKQNNNIINLPIDLSKKIEDTVVLEL